MTTFSPWEGGTDLPCTDPSAVPYRTHSRLRLVGRPRPDGETDLPCTDPTEAHYWAIVQRLRRLPSPLAGVDEITAPMMRTTSLVDRLADPDAEVITTQAAPFADTAVIMRTRYKREHKLTRRTVVYRSTLAGWKVSRAGIVDPHAIMRDHEGTLAPESPQLARLARGRGQAAAAAQAMLIGRSYRRVLRFRPAPKRTTGDTVELLAEGQPRRGKRDPLTGIAGPGVRLVWSTPEDDAQARALALLARSVHSTKEAQNDRQRRSRAKRTPEQLAMARLKDAARKAASRAIEREAQERGTRTPAIPADADV